MILAFLATSSQTQTVTFTAVVSDNVAIDTVSLPGTTLRVQMLEHLYLLSCMIMMILDLEK